MGIYTRNFLHNSPFGGRQTLNDYSNVYAEFQSEIYQLNAENSQSGRHINEWQTPGNKPGLGITHAYNLPTPDPHVSFKVNGNGRA